MRHDMTDDCRSAVLLLGDIRKQISKAYSVAERDKDERLMREIAQFDYAIVELAATVLFAPHREPAAAAPRRPH
jgi:hypothetical protein